MNNQKTLNEEEQYQRIPPKIKCKICGREFEKITSTHLKKHNIIVHEYKVQFPDALLVSDGWCKKQREVNLGKYHTEASKQHMSDNHADFSGENHPMYGKRSGNYKDGISFLPYCEKFDENLKERVRDFFNRCCYICGKSEQEQIEEMISNGKRPIKKLDVHHVNYDKMVCCNDVKPLFVPLCHSCHMKTQKDRK